MKPIVVWFRRDLRTHDQAALYQAAKIGAPVIPLFVFDSDLIRRLPSDGAAFDFQAESLRELQKNIRSLGGTLILRHGKAKTVHEEILREMSPAALYFNRDYEPSARTRDAEIMKLYESHDVEVLTFKDSVLLEPEEVLTGEGKPYVVFTPYANAWKKLSKPSPFGKCPAFSTPRMKSEAILSADSLQREVTITSRDAMGGESEARKRWKTFLKNHLEAYQSGRDIPAIDGTSRMSPYLRFGCISVRHMLNDCYEAFARTTAGGKIGITKFVDELIWREFYQAVLFHFPQLVTSNYRKRFDEMPWKFSRKTFEAWKHGRTGYPLVDAGMRQLNQTGWMHNRVRMVVASFLTKDLMHDWKLGAEYFEQKLIDIETASNNGGWQWSAATGVDPKPLRIFNPRLQSERFDPEGTYIRRFVPELAQVPKKHIHAPHEMPLALQKELGCVIGNHYPAPIVDHAAAAAEYKRNFAALKKTE